MGSSPFDSVRAIARTTWLVGVSWVLAAGAVSVATAAVMVFAYQRAITWQWDALSVWSTVLVAALAMLAAAVVMFLPNPDVPEAREMAFRRIAREWQEVPLGYFTAAELHALLYQSRWMREPSGLWAGLTESEVSRLQRILSVRSRQVPEDGRVVQLAARHKAYSGRLSDMAAALSLSEPEVGRLEILAGHLGYGLGQGPAPKGDGTLARIFRTFTPEERPSRIFLELLAWPERKHLLLRQIFEKGISSGVLDGEMLAGVWEDVELMHDAQLEVTSSLLGSWHAGPRDLTRTALLLA